MKETVVSGAIRSLVVLMNGFAYSTESGAIGQWVGEPGQRKFLGRPGGTRGTPGWPDLSCLMERPVRYILTVEAKGTSTQIRESQWEYAARAMQLGQPHLIARSQEAFFTGLWFLGLLPKLWLERPPVPRYREEWPDNAQFLERTRILFWEQLRAVPEYPLPSQAEIRGRTKWRFPPPSAGL